MEEKERNGGREKRVALGGEEGGGFGNENEAKPLSPPNPGAYLRGTGVTDTDKYKRQQLRAILIISNVI